MHSMRWCHRMGVVLGASVGLVACGGGSANNQPATGVANSAVDDGATADLTEYHRYHHHGGVTLFIAMSLDTLGVSPEQQAAVERIRKRLHETIEPVRAAEQTLTAALADGVAAGNMDAAKVDTGVAQVTAAAAAVHDASVSPLNELHSVLTPSQRAALVDKVDAHWAVWQRANGQEIKANREGSHLAMLTTDLGLTADQTNDIRARLGEGMTPVSRLEPQEMAAPLRVFGDAFRSETFDAKGLTGTGGANAHVVGWGAVQMARFVEAVSSVLTVDQRAKFAQRLRAHATHDSSAEAKP